MILKTKILTALVILPMAAIAAPTLYPTDINVLATVLNTTDSFIIADDKDAKTIWVLPPKAATAKVNGIHTIGANVGFCKGMVDSQKHIESLQTKLSELGLKEVEMAGKLSELQEKASKKNEEAEKFASLNGIADLALLDARVKDLQDRNEAIILNLNNCADNCLSLAEEMRVNTNELRSLFKDRREIFKRSRLAAEKYEGLKKEAAAAQKTVENQQKVYHDLRDRLVALDATFMQVYKRYAELEGGFASFSYRSHWDENITKLREKNPGFNFSKVVTHTANLMTELNATGFPNGGSAIMGMSVAGTSGIGNSVIYTDYPESVDANVRLSLVGACPQLFPSHYNFDQSVKTEMNYGVIISYNYETVYTRKAIATYNMYKMYQKIVTSGKRGGFFRRRSFSAVEERNYFRDSFSVEWDDTENVWSDEQKAEMEREMRDNVFTRLATLMLPEQINRAEIIAATEPGKSGATVLSEALNEKCGAVIQCQVGSVVLNFLDAVFGSTKMTSSYTNIQDAVITENISHRGKISKSWITTYVRK